MNIYYIILNINITLYDIDILLYSHYTIILHYNFITLKILVTFTLFNFDYVILYYLLWFIIIFSFLFELCFFPSYIIIKTYIFPSVSIMFSIQFLLCTILCNSLLLVSLLFLAIKVQLCANTWKLLVFYLFYSYYYIIFMLFLLFF